MIKNSKRGNDGQKVKRERRIVERYRRRSGVIIKTKTKKRVACFIFPPCTAKEKKNIKES